MSKITLIEKCVSAVKMDVSVLVPLDVLMLRIQQSVLKQL